MKRKNKASLILIIVLLLAVIGMSIGFAFTDITLSINGDVTTKKQTWDIHFNPTSVVTTSGSVTPTSSPSFNTENTTVTYTVTLEKVGDFYEFTIDAKNYGDFDAKLSSITITGGTDYLSHTVKYNESSISNGTVNNANVISKNESDTYTIRVEYLEPSDESKLPTEDITATYSVTLVYTQSKAS